jgi:predicted ATPase
VFAPAIANLWLFNAARGRLDRCGEISADLFRIARELDDPAVMLQAQHCTWPTKFLLGLFAESKAHSEAGGAIYDETAHARHRHVYLGHDPGVCSLHFRALAQGLLGFPERGARLESEGVSLARRLQHPPSLAFSLWLGCESSILRGDVSAVTTMAQELLGLTDAQELPLPRASAMMLLGWALSRSGETMEGIARQEQGLAMMAKMGMQIHLTFFLTLMAESLLAAGRYSDGLRQVDRAIGISEQGGEQWSLPRLHQLRAELRSQAYGRGDQAVERSLQRAIAIAQHQGAKGWEIGAATKLASLWAERGRRAEAQDLLWPIYSWFTEGFDTPDLIDAKTVLDELK